MISHEYRGFEIRIARDGDQFRPHWSEPMMSKWIAGRTFVTQEDALAHAKEKIDRQYLIESEQLDEAGKQ